MSFTDPYLEAIQAVPGDTPNEKFRCIAKIIKNRGQTGDVPLQVENWKEIPQPLVSLVKIEAAKMFKTYDAVTEALKSKDNFIVTKALQANWYFDGRNKDVTNVNYFFENLFPYVSLKTRIQIVKHLSRNLIKKEPKLAEEFFVALSNAYGIDQMTRRLLEACSESFAYDAIVRHRIILRACELEIMYRNKPNLVIRYLRLKCNSHCIHFYECISFLPTLIKKNLDVFIEIFYCDPFTTKLSKKNATILLKNAKEEVKKKPKLFIEILPLKLIDTNLLESIFPKLFPEDIKKFQTDNMLSYLEYYPANKKVLLLFKSYKEMYDKNLLDNIKNVTPNLLKILPEEQRIEQARLLLTEKQSKRAYVGDYSTTWRCYLPVQEAIDAIQNDISTAKSENDRTILVEQMFYTCKINHDNDVLLRVLKYCNSRHKNENASFWSQLFFNLMHMYEIENLSEKHWNVIDDIIVRNHVKEFLVNDYTYNYRPLIEKYLQHKLKNNLSFDQMIEIYADLELTNYENRWSILRDYPEYELKCFDATLNIIKIRFESNNQKWLQAEISIMADLLNEIYDYNMRHVKSKTGRQKLSLKNYPWLMQKVHSILLDESKKKSVKDIKNTLLTNEEDLYTAWFTEEEKIEKFDFNKALFQLKQNPKSILDHYKKYMDNYSQLFKYSTVRRFLLACRWYKDIPIKFANEGMKRLQTDNDSAYLCFLGILFHGDTFTKLVKPYITTEKTINIKNKDAADNYRTLTNALSSMLLSNPPIPVELTANLCESDYLSLVLRIIRNVCNRTPIINIKTFANSLTEKRVSVRKHGIRLMFAIQPLQESLDFLLSQWKTEKHHSVREVIFQKVSQLFMKEPRPITWSTFRECFSTLTVKDWPIVKNNEVPFWNMPTEYTFGFIKLMVQVIDNFVKEGLEKEETMQYLGFNFRKIDNSVANVLPDDFCEEIIEKYLFDPDYLLESFARQFLVQKYLYLRNDKMESRMKVLSRIFKNAIKNGWDAPHPQKEYFYPVNYTIHMIIHDIAGYFLCNKDKDPIIIDCALNFYDDFLLPEMDITNYFLLILAKEYAGSSTMDEFARKFGQKLPEIMEKHTPHYLGCFISTLQTFFHLMLDDNIEEIELIVRDALLECSSHYAHLVAVSNLLNIRRSANVPRYAALIKKLKNHDNPEIKGIFYSKINSTDFYSCP